MNVTWKEVNVDSTEQIELFIGETCIGWIKNIDSVNLVKESLNHKNCIVENKTRILSTVTISDFGDGDAYSCPFCGSPDDENCNC